MPVTLAPVPHMQFFDSAGNPLVNGKVFTFQAGTSTPLATYTDSTGATPNANPIILDAAGFANIWLTNNIAYKFQVQNSASVTQWTVDNVVALGSSTINPQKQVFTAGGTFTIPTTSVKVTVVGGGGGGGGSDGTHSGCGGGSGGVGIKWLSGLTPGLTLTVVIGTGGNGGTSVPTNGSPGTASSVASGTQTISTITANGGGGGPTAVGLNGGGAGATAGSGGDTNFAGNSAPALTSIAIQGQGAGSIFGGASQQGAGAVGATATVAGSGGAGAQGASFAGGAGAAGIVIFEWVA